MAGGPIAEAFVQLRIDASKLDAETRTAVNRAFDHVDTAAREAGSKAGRNLSTGVSKGTTAMREDVSRAATSMESKMRGVGTEGVEAGRKVKVGMTEAAAATHRVGVQAEESESHMSKIGSGLKSALIGGGLLLGVGLLVSKFKEWTAAGQEAAAHERVTAALIKTTGGVANVTADSLTHYIDRIAVMTGVEADQIRTGANVLLSFRNVRNEVGKGNDIYNRAIADALDLSTVMGKGLSSSLLQVGKALQDPTKGYSRLQRAGVAFTDSQVAQIKTLQASGNILGAQKIILGELEHEFGGAARAAADPMKRLQVAWTQLKETIGKKVIEWAGPAIDGLAHLQHPMLLLAETIGHSLGPFIGDLVSAGRRLIDVLREMAQGAAPVLRAFALLAGAAVVGTLRLIANLLGETLGLLAKHPALVRAIGIAFAAWGITSIIGDVVVGLRVMATTVLQFGVNSVGSFALAKTAAGGFAGVMIDTLGPIALVALALRSLDAFQGAIQHGKDFRKTLESIGSAHSFSSIEKEALTAQLAVHKLSKEVSPDGKNPFASFGSGMVAGLQVVGKALGVADTKVLNHQKQLEAAQKVYKVSSAQLTLLGNSVNSLSGLYGLSRNAVTKLLESDQKLDLRTATSKQLTESLVGSMKSLSDATGIKAPKALLSLAQGLATSGIDVKAFSKELVDAEKAADGAIRKFFDFSTAKLKTPDASGVIAWFQEQLKVGKQFADGISTLISSGVNAGLVQSLIAAGPAANAQVQAIVNGIKSGTTVGGQSFVGFLNQSEGTITKIARFAMESQREIFLATHSGMQRLVDEQSTAARISQLTWQGMKPVDIAAILHLDRTHFNQIVTDFGLSAHQIDARAAAPHPKYVMKGDNTDAVGKSKAAQRLADVFARGKYQANLTAQDPLALTKTTEATNRASRYANGNYDAALKAHPNLATFSWVQSILDNLTKTRTVIVNTEFGTSNPIPGVRGPRRYGGIVHAMRGMIGDGRGSLTMWNEPGTGGEAFIPRNIPDSQALPLLQTAARWHGMTVRKGTDVATVVNVDAGAIVIHVGAGASPKAAAMAGRAAAESFTSTLAHRRVTLAAGVKR